VSFPVKARHFWPLLLGLILADCSSKRLAQEHLALDARPREVVGEIVRFTLAYNPGAALNLSLGPYSRVGFTLLALLAVVVLLRLYRSAAPDERWRPVGLALVAGGALGNALDRLRSPLGVVDFIDIGFGGTRFYTFNVADVGITVGVLILAVVTLHLPDPDPDHLPAPRWPARPPRPSRPSRPGSRTGSRTGAKRRPSLS